MSQEREDNTREVNRNTNAFSRLNSAIDGLGSMVGSIVRGNPQRISPLIQATENLIPGMGALSKAMAFAEGYIEVWQGLTRSGVHFNNEIDQMIISVGQANTNLETLSRLIKSNGQEFAGMGGTIQTGINLFLTRQASFMSETDEEYKRLRASLNTLGYTSETLTETFAAYDQLTTIQGISTRLTERERNRAATEYAKTLDELARLTGKQTDALAEEQAEISRQGNVFAFGQTLDTQVRDELDNGLLALKQVAPSVKDFAVDILTRGFPNMDDPEMRALNAAAPGLRSALQEARQAFLDGDEARARILMDQALAEASQLRNNRFLINQAMLGSATDISQGSMNIMTELSSGIALSGDAIRAEAERIARANGEEFTGSAAQIDAGLQSIIRTERDAQTSRTSESQQVLETYLGGIRQLQTVAMRAQEATVNAIFAGVQVAAAKFVDWVSGQDGDSALDALLGSVEGELGDLVRAIQEAGPGNARGTVVAAASNDITATATAVLERLSTAGANQADIDQFQSMVNELLTKSTQLSRDLGNTQLIDEVLALQRQVGTLNRDSGIDTEVAAADIENWTQAQKDAFAAAIREVQGRSGGSLGEVGKLFEDFGRGTLMQLHGLEAVVTPDQMASIVQSSALGGMGAVSTLLESGFTNNTNALDGMLNTVRNMPSELASATQDTGNDEIRDMLTNLATQLREPLESAMNNTLVPKLEQLVAVNTDAVDATHRVRKGLSGLNNDVLRSI